MEYQTSFIDRFSLDSIEVEKGACIRTSVVSHDQVLYFIKNFKNLRRSLDLYWQQHPSNADEFVKAETKVFRKFVDQFTRHPCVTMNPYTTPGECNFSVFDGEVVYAPIYAPEDGCLLAGSIKAWIRYNISQNA